MIYCLTYFSVQSDLFLENLNFYFYFVNITVNGNIAVYIKYFAVRLKIDYTLRCIEYTNREDTVNCTLTITFTVLSTALLV